MKKKLLTALSAAFLLLSCSQEDLSDVRQQDFDEAISQFTKEYEIKVLGLGFENLEKDEVTPSTTKETRGSDKLIAFIKDSLERSYSKTSVKQTKANPSGEGLVGVLKHSSCGSYREFKFHQDNEDGGWTNTFNSGESSADGNKNMNWSFCLVPGHAPRPLNPIPGQKLKPYHYGGGVLLLYTYTPDQWDPSEHGDIDVVLRYHDDEDHSNKNAITNMGGQTWESNNRLGECFFGSNTSLTWRFSDKRNISLPFKYGVLTNDFSGYDGYISIDDENGGNTNIAFIHTFKTGTGPDAGIKSREVSGRKERFRGVGIWDTNTDYYIKWYN